MSLTKLLQHANCPSRMSMPGGPLRMFLNNILCGSATPEVGLAARRGHFFCFFLFIWNFIPSSALGLALTHTRTLCRLTPLHLFFFFFFFSSPSRLPPSSSTAAAHPLVFSALAPWCRTSPFHTCHRLLSQVSLSPLNPPSQLPAAVSMV